MLCLGQNMLESAAVANCGTVLTRASFICHLKLSLRKSLKEARLLSSSRVKLMPKQGLLEHSASYTFGSSCTAPASQSSHLCVVHNTPLLQARHSSAPLLNSKGCRDDDRNEMLTS